MVRKTVFVRMWQGKFCFLLVLLILGGGRDKSHARQAPVPNQVSPRQHSPFEDLGGNNPLDAEKRVRALNDDRHKAMISDAAKLLKMARQLDAEVARNDSDELTPAELRELATIEKLAHSVKEKMVLTWEGGPQFRDLGAPMSAVKVPPKPAR